MKTKINIIMVTQKDDSNNKYTYKLLKTIELNCNEYVRIPNIGERLCISYDENDFDIYVVNNIGTELDDKDSYICYTIYVE